MEERREELRHRVLKPAQITWGSGAALDCVIRNISGQGACLEVASPLGIPPNFTLMLDNNRSKRECRIVWRTERRIGVAFI
jgi:hypothetical protein